MHSYDAIVIGNTDHFLMMNCAEEFTRALERAVEMLMEKGRPGKAG